MAFDPLTAILNIGNTVLDRVLPDKAANDTAKAQLASAALQGEFNEVLGQLEINKTEAAANSTWVAGWRPGIGWGCGAAMVYNFLAQPFIITLIQIIHCIRANVAFEKSMLPIVDMSQMWPVLLALLGMGALRSYDKANSVGNGQ